MEIINKKEGAPYRWLCVQAVWCAGRLYRLSSGLGKLFTPNTAEGYILPISRFLQPWIVLGIINEMVRRSVLTTTIFSSQTIVVPFLLSAIFFSSIIFSAAEFWRVFFGWGQKTVCPTGRRVSVFCFGARLSLFGLCFFGAKIRGLCFKRAKRKK